MTDQEQNERAARWLRNIPEGYPGSTPDFANDANAWPQIHAELERRGLVGKYRDSLYDAIREDLVKQPLNWREAVDWCFIKATPAQCLSALMKVLEEVEKDG